MSISPQKSFNAYASFSLMCLFISFYHFYTFISLWLLNNFPQIYQHPDLVFLLVWVSHKGRRVWMEP